MPTTPRLADLVNDLDRARLTLEAAVAAEDDARDALRRARATTDEARNALREATDAYHLNRRHAVS